MTPSHALAFALLRDAACCITYFVCVNCLPKIMLSLCLVQDAASSIGTSHQSHPDKRNFMCVFTTIRSTLSSSSSPAAAPSGMLASAACAGRVHTRRLGVGGMSEVGKSPYEYPKYSLLILTSTMVRSYVCLHDPCARHLMRVHNTVDALPDVGVRVI